MERVNLHVQMLWLLLMLLLLLVISYGNSEPARTDAVDVVDKTGLIQRIGVHSFNGK